MFVFEFANDFFIRESFAKVGYYESCEPIAMVLKHILAPAAGTPNVAF